jgi:Na+/proline symporter
VYDWLGRRSLSLKSSRDLTVILGTLVIVAALAAPLLGDNVVDILGTVAGTLLGALMAVFLLGMFAPRANASGVLIGLVAGAVCLGGVWLATDVPRWWYGAFTVLPTLVVGVAASHLFPPPPTGRAAPLVRKPTPSPSSPRGRELL